MAYNLLAGKRGIIFGALDDRSLAWRVALKAKEEGAAFTLTNTALALRMGTLNGLGQQCDAPIIAADVTVIEEVNNLISESVEKLGGPLDFILHSVGMSPNVRKKRSYTDIDYGFFQKTLDISAISLHKVLQCCMKQDALAQGASVVTLSYIAAQRTFPDYSDMAEAKATLESIVRSFGYHYGTKKGVRINSVSQSPTVTSAGSGVGGFDVFYEFANKMSPLGNASADDCASYCISLFSDLTRMVTMQNLYHDGGYSSVGISADMMAVFSDAQTAK